MVHTAIAMALGRVQQEDCTVRILRIVCRITECPYGMQIMPDASEVSSQPSEFKPGQSRPDEEVGKSTGTTCHVSLPRQKSPLWRITSEDYFENDSSRAICDRNDGASEYSPITNERGNTPFVRNHRTAYRIALASARNSVVRAQPPWQTRDKLSESKTITYWVRESL